MTNYDISISISQTDLEQTITIKYCQYLNLPRLGSNQTGNPHYFSPMFIYTFSIYNSITDHWDVYIHIYIYIYTYIYIYMGFEGL